MNMTKWARMLTVGLLTLVLVFSIPGCGLYHSVFDDKVVTTMDNVKPDVPADHIAKAPTQGVLTPEQEKRLVDSGKELVIVDKTEVKAPEKAATVTNPNEDTLGDWLGIGVSIGKVFFPGIAGLEALGILLSQRKRTHYAAAIQSILPTDGSVDLGEAATSVAKALGFAHSNEASKQAAKTVG